MTRLLFVGDGARDEAILPPLVSTILNACLTPEFDAWARLNSAGRGYDRKLRYQILRARDRDCVGVVAVVDQDKDRQGRRLRSLRQSRDEFKMQHRYVPTAVGEAIPHGEAWLIDDPKAVRSGMGLATDTEVPAWRERDDCKSLLETLHAGCPRRNDSARQIWANIAAEIDPARFLHPGETGFEAFAADVRAELAGAITG